jgi:hypothetical protein
MPTVMLKHVKSHHQAEKHAIHLSAAQSLQVVLCAAAAQQVTVAMASVLAVA